MKSLTPIIATFLLLAAAASAQDGAALFNKQCKACHTIGGGVKVGPDLAGVTSKRDFDWLVKFVKSSKNLIATGDPDAVAIFEKFNKKPMPSHSNSVAEIQGMLDFIASGGASPDESESGKEKISLIFEPDAEKGRELFTGELALTNGGPSCISCHNVRHNDVVFGGSMAMDLSVSHKENIVEAMETSMPAMINSYGNSPLSVDERANLDLFLKVTKENQLYQTPGQFGGIFFLLGAIFFIFMLIIIHLFWRSNRKMGVKDEIFKRQMRTQ
ncbi:MAG: cytochrome c [Bacteroidales bacterium]|nr:cytochrome c [Bacteroidota bacterium]MBL6949180.1 cytochrome c [Bacteroidales bacterium]